MFKKILLIFISLISILSVTKIEAVSQSNFIDMQTYTNIYKLSEESDVELPFIKLFNEKATFDKKLEKSGLIISSKGIEITDDINNFQVIVASDTVEVKGNMEYAMIFAPNVVISGTIEKDIFIIAQSVFITETANIMGDIIVVSESVEMNGTSHGNFIASSNDFMMNGNVLKDFRVYSQKISFEETDIKGDIYIETQSDLNISEKYQNAVVNKIQEHVLTEAEKKNQIVQTSIEVITGIVLFTLFNMLIRKIKPEFFKKLANKAVNHSSFVIIMGMLVLTTIPIIVIFTVICSLFGLGVVTTPLFVIYIALIIAIIALAKFIVGSTLYELFKKKIKINSSFKEVGLLIAVFAAMYLVCYIPYIADVVTMAIVLLSAGIIVTGLLKKEQS